MKVLYLHFTVGETTIIHSTSVTPAIHQTQD